METKYNVLSGIISIIFLSIIVYIMAVGNNDVESH